MNMKSKFKKTVVLILSGILSFSMMACSLSKKPHKGVTPANVNEKYEFAMEDAGLVKIVDEGEGVVKALQSSDAYDYYLRATDKADKEYFINNAWNGKYEIDYDEVVAFYRGRITDTSYYTNIWIYEFADEEMAKQHFEYAVDMHMNQYVVKGDISVDVLKEDSDRVTRSMKIDDSTEETRDVIRDENLVVVIFYRNSSSGIFKPGTYNAIYEELGIANPRDNF